jgi:hypothetical protein
LGHMLYEVDHIFQEEYPIVAFDLFFWLSYLNFMYGKDLNSIYFSFIL